MYKQRILNEARVLLNLLNELGKSDNTRGLLSILSLFRQVSDKFNNTGALMIDSTYHLTLKLLKIGIFGMKTSRFCRIFRKGIMGVITSPFQICKPL